MIKIIIVIMICICSVDLSYAKVDTHTVSKKVIDLTTEAMSLDDNRPKLSEALDLLNNALKEEPENRFLLNMRSMLHGTMENWQSSREDLETLIALRPDASSYLFRKCILDEKFGVPKKEYMQCYNKALELAAVELGDKKYTDPGYIMGLYMAERPEAQIYAENYMKTPSNTDIEAMLKEKLKNFKREDLLQ